MVRLGIRRFYLLLVLTLLLGSAFAGCNQGSTSDFVKKQQAQEKAVAVLTDLGAKIEKKDTGFAQAWVVDLSQVQFTPEIARQLSIVGYSMSVLKLSKTSINDNQLTDLFDQKALDAIAELDLSHNSAITDQSLDKIASLFNLCDLDLVGTQVTEAGIARLLDKRKPRQLVSDDVIKKSTPEGIHKSAPEAFKRELKIRH